jgi:multidrug efflux pump subunit AcrA (membrane-fusion protein)
MEHEVKNRRKDKIKNAAIIFLVIMLILTLCAPTILNFSLPQVAVIMPNRSPISEQIRGNATVEAASTYDVKAESVRKIGAVMVKEGELVTKGQTLFTLSEDDNAEYEELESRIETLQNEYDKMLLTVGKDYSLENLAIEQDKNALAELEEKKLEAPTLEKAYETAVAARKTAEALQTELTEQKADVDSIISDFAAENYDFLDPEYAKVLDTLVAEKEKIDLSKTQSDLRLKDLEAQLAAAGGSDLSSYRRAVESAQAAVDAAEDAYNNFMITNTKPNGDVSAGEALARLYADVTAAQNALSSAQAEYSEAAAAAQDANSIKGRLNAERKTNDTLQQRSDKKKKEIADKRVEINKILRERAQKLEDGINDAKKAVTEATEAENEAKEDMGETEEAIEAKIVELEYKIKTAELTLAQKQQDDAAAAGASAVDLKAKKDELDRAVAKLEDAKTDAKSTEIVAPVDGTVMSVGISSGTAPKEGDTLCTLAVLEQGYQASFSVSADQARRVTVGAKAELENYWWGNEIAVTLSRIANDPSDPAKKILTFKIVGEISVGYNLSIAVGERATDFSSVIPASAIREDNDGKFVLVCVQKSTPIGSRYTAERKAVTVVATNGQQSAVDGSLENGEWVITTSTKPLSAGTQVRLKD